MNSILLFHEHPITEILRAVALLSIVIPAAVIDYRTKIIPDKLTLLGAALSLPFLLQSKESLIYGLIGSVFAGGMFWLIAIISRGGMGGGDIKLAAVIGLYLGLFGTMATVIVSFTIGGLFGIFMLLLKRMRLKDGLPFGPFLALGVVMTLVIT